VCRPKKKVKFVYFFLRQVLAIFREWLFTVTRQFHLKKPLRRVKQKGIAILIN